MRYLPLFLCLAFFACDSVDDDGDYVSSSSDRQPDGACFVRPTVSKNTLNFNKSGGTDIVVVNGASLFSGRDNEECKYIRPDYYLMQGNSWVKIENEYCKTNYCRFMANETPNGFPYIIYESSDSAPVTKIECSWYSVAYIDETSLQVSVNQNETGKERSESIDFFAGDCGEVGFTITQSP